MKIVAIIGSTRFKDWHLGAAQRETLRGNIALICGFFHHKDNYPITDEQKKMLDALSAKKVEMSDEVFVVNVHGYVGETTAGLIKLAEKLVKPIRYLETGESGFISSGSGEPPHSS